MLLFLVVCFLPRLHKFGITLIRSVTYHLKVSQFTLHVQDKNKSELYRKTYIPLIDVIVSNGVFFASETLRF